MTFEEFCQLKNKLNKVGELPLKINGNSMLPLLENENLIQAIPLQTNQELRRFDIIVFWQEERLLCHYFWKKNELITQKGESFLVTKPLNPLNGIDHPIAKNQILGIVKNAKISWHLQLMIIFRQIFN